MSDTIENDVFQQALAESVHFSFKTINSNIEKGGLRLSKAQALDLPYISARTLLAENFLIPTDYQANAGKTASIFKVVKAAMLDDDVAEEDAEFQHQVAQLKSSINNIFTQPYQAGTEHIDIRMRQLLLPKEDGYVAVSPLTAAGVNYLLNQEVDKVNEARKEKDSPYYRIQTAVFGIGGANPQNVGSLVRAMQRPIAQSAPQASSKIRQALAVFYNGFSYRILRKIKLSDDGTGSTKQSLEQWAEILHRQLVVTANNTIQNWHDLEIFAPTTKKSVRDQEEMLLKIIVLDVLRQGLIQKNILEEAQSILPTIDAIERPSFWVHPSLSFVIQGLIDPELRDDYWRMQFANHLAKRITTGKLTVETENQTVEISLDHNAEGYIARRLQGIIR